MDECVVCCSEVEGTFGPQKSPLDQLNDLLQIFRISLASFSEHLKTDDELPPKLFCAKCRKRMQEAVYTLAQIQCLQNDLKILIEFLKQDLLTQTIDAKNASRTNWIYSVRKSLVQCFSPCQVNVEGVPGVSRLPANQLVQNSSEGVEGLPSELIPGGSAVKVEVEMNEAEDPTGDLANVLRPDTVLVECHLKNELLVDSDTASNAGNVDPFEGLSAFGSNEEEGSNLVGDTVPSYNEAEAESRTDDSDPLCQEKLPVDCDPFEVTSKDAGMRYERTETLGSCRWFLIGSQTNIGFQCLLCNMKISRSDYKTKEGRFAFKCTHEACKDRFQVHKFRHLGFHHQIHCPARRKDKMVGVPQRVPVGESITINTTDKEQRNTIVSILPTPRINTPPETSQDGNNTQICKIEADTAIPATLDGASNVSEAIELKTITVPQTVVTSETTTQEVRSAIEGGRSTGKLRKMENGYIFDSIFGVIAFECPICNAHMSRSDYETKFGKFTFKCKQDSCNVITRNFPDLTRHHQTHHLRQSKWVMTYT